MAWAGTCGSGYNFSIALKLHKASGSDQTNFAVPINVRDIRLATVANGGNIQHTVVNSLSRTVPADLVICPDQTLTSTPLKYETEFYGATYGDWTAFIQTPTLHFGSYDTVYLYANNAAVTTDQEDLTMWSDLSYAAVWHLPNVDMKDSSGNGHNGTMNGTVPATIHGAFDGAAGNDTGIGSWSNLNFITVPSSSGFKQGTNVTWEAWANPFSGGNYNKIMSLDYRANGTWNTPYCVCLQLDGNSTHVSWHLVSAGTVQDLSSATTLLGFDAHWQKIDATYNGSTAKVFIDGTQDANTLNFAGGIDYGTSANLTIGNRSQYSPDEYWLGDLDELRIRNVVSSTDYIATGAALSPYTSTFQFGTQTATSPVAQHTPPCGAAGTAASCAFPFPVTAGVLVAAVQTVDTDCNTIAMPNDSAGNVYTRQVRSDFTGTLHHYYNCIYTAPVTGTGTITVTTPNPGPGSNVAATVFEVHGISVTGLQTAFTNNTSPPATMSLTASHPNTFIIGLTRGGSGVSQPSYTSFIGASSSDGDHYAQTSVAYAVVGSGSQSMSFTGGPGAVMVMFDPAPSATAIRHRSAMY